MNEKKTRWGLNYQKDTVKAHHEITFGENVDDCLMTLDQQFHYVSVISVMYFFHHYRPTVYLVPISYYANKTE